MFVFNIFVFNIPVKCASFLNKIWLPKKVEKAEMFKFVKTPAPLPSPLDSHSSHNGKKQNPFYDKTFKGSSKIIFNALFVLRS